MPNLYQIPCVAYKTSKPLANIHFKIMANIHFKIIAHNLVIPAISHSKK